MQPLYFTLMLGVCAVFLYTGFYARKLLKFCINHFFNTFTLPNMSQHLSFLVVCRYLYVLNQYLPKCLLHPSELQALPHYKQCGWSSSHSKPDPSSAAASGILAFRTAEDHTEAQLLLPGVEPSGGTIDNVWCFEYLGFVVNNKMGCFNDPTTYIQLAEAGSMKITSWRTYLYEVNTSI